MGKATKHRFDRSDVNGPFTAASTAFVIFLKGGRSQIFCGHVVTHAIAEKVVDTPDVISVEGVPVDGGCG